MKVWTTLSDDAIYDIANAIGVSIADRGSVNSHRNPITTTGGIRGVPCKHFGLRPDRGFVNSEGNYRYQRVSASVFQNERRVFAVCWHGYRDFLLALFEHDPSARVKTVFADYRGKDDFLDKYPDTAWRNIGSLMYPVYAAEACTC